MTDKEKFIDHLPEMILPFNYYHLEKSDKMEDDDYFDWRELRTDQFRSTIMLGFPFYKQISKLH